MGKQTRARQSRAYHKQRKAKARVAHQAAFRTWIDRPRGGSSPRVSRMAFDPFAAGISLSEEALCRLMGEEFRDG